MNVLVFPDGYLHVGDKKYRCALGRGGVIPAHLKTEGDGGTPAGEWPVRRIWYRADRITLPPTALPVLAITPNDGWCDDPASLDYNRPVVLPFSASHEALWREDDVYDIILELGYNDSPVVSGKGSAIFLHIARDGYPPTDGCVAVSLADMLEIIPQLGAGSRAVINEN